MPGDSVTPAFNAEAIDELAEGLGLGPHLAKPGYMLSAGTRRKVWLAGAFASGAAVTLLDEPFAALDKASIGFVLELLDDAAASSTRAWVVADYEAPRGVPLAAEVDLGD
jgi:energy-coupling factor transporter ATP-binding protein EcfA2